MHFTVGSSAVTPDLNRAPIPARKELWALARANYLSYLLTLTYGPQFITFMLSRFAGLEATAAFGFARNLADQVRRYLPAELLYGLVRPALIARYAATRDVAAFNRNNALLFQVSLMFLAPLLVLGIAYGDVLVRVSAMASSPTVRPCSPCCCWCWSPTATDGSSSCSPIPYPSRVSVLRPTHTSPGAAPSCCSSCGRGSPSGPQS